jgi:hypothetical protein
LVFGARHHACFLWTNTHVMSKSNLKISNLWNTKELAVFFYFKFQT